MPICVNCDEAISICEINGEPICGDCYDLNYPDDEISVCACGDDLPKPMPIDDGPMCRNCAAGVALDIRNQEKLDTIRGK